MFNSFKDMFKDMYLEAAGYDVKKMKEEKRKIEEMKKQEIIIFSNKSKHIIRGIGILFIFIAILCISSFLQNKNYIEIFKYSFMIFLDIVGMICISKRNKKSEIIGLCIIIVFVILNFVVPVI